MACGEGFPGREYSPVPYLFADTQLSSEVGGVTHPSTPLLTRKPDQEAGKPAQGHTAWVHGGLVAVGKREEGGGTFEPQ